MSSINVHWLSKCMLFFFSMIYLFFSRKHQSKCILWNTCCFRRNTQCIRNQPFHQQEHNHALEKIADYCHNDFRNHLYGVHSIDFHRETIEQNTTIRKPRWRCVSCYQIFKRFSNLNWNAKAACMYLCLPNT